jgi:hypothetical protein
MVRSRVLLFICLSLTLAFGQAEARRGARAPLRRRLGIAGLIAATVVVGASAPRVATAVKSLARTVTVEMSKPAEAPRYHRTSAYRDPWEYDRPLPPRPASDWMDADGRSVIMVP